MDDPLTSVLTTTLLSKEISRADQGLLNVSTASILINSFITPF
jgi:hypothetical protein